MNRLCYVIGGAQSERPVDGLPIIGRHYQNGRQGMGTLYGLELGANLQPGHFWQQGVYEDDIGQQRFRLSKRLVPVYGLFYRVSIGFQGSPQVMASVGISIGNQDEGIIRMRIGQSGHVSPQRWFGFNERALSHVCGDAAAYFPSLYPTT